MKKLTKINERVATTLMEEVDGRQIYYQFETNKETPTPEVVSFSTRGQNETTLSGSYSQNGGFNLNGQGVNNVNDLQIVNEAFATILEIINPRQEKE